MQGGVVVFDIGKSLAKLSLWDDRGQMLEQRSRPNLPVDGGGYRALDVARIEGWLSETLREFAKRGAVAAIVPVGHGAAAAIIDSGKLACPVPDYEEGPAAAARKTYDIERDLFWLTGSPALPDGLNLGAQLHRLESLRPGVMAKGQILPWAQFWAWKLCGVAASEMTSLGCHTDLWRPGANTPSGLAKRRGWAQKMAPLRHAGEVLGTLTPEWVARTGLSPKVQVYCGLHDSNASLLAARGFAEIAPGEATTLSTGTWFVAMRTPAEGVSVDLNQLPEARDCLVNVDVDGRAIPSARFMGGRELEILGGVELGEDQAATLAALPEVLARGVMALPSFAAGVGPYPKGQGRWLNGPEVVEQRRAAVALYAALMVDASLELIGSKERLLIEGRFGQCEVFVRALAALRPDMAVFVYGGREGLSFGVPYGALRLIAPALPPPGSLRRVTPLDMDLSAYKARWREEASK